MFDLSNKKCPCGTTLFDLSNKKCPCGTTLFDLSKQKCLCSTRIIFWIPAYARMTKNFAKKAKEIMEGVLTPKETSGVPIIANSAIGPNWGEMTEV